MITVGKLIEILNTVKNKELPVVLVTDHGQTPMALSGHGEAVVEDITEYMMEEMFDGDEGDECYFLTAY